MFTGRLCRAAALSRARISSRPVALPSVRSAYRSIVTTRYTTDHESVVFDTETGVGTISITDYAQSSLGDVVFVELPNVGTTVNQGDQIGAIESVKAASDIYAPVSGIVEEINKELDDKPGLLNKVDDEKGWLCKVKLSNPSEVEGLLTADAYKAHCESEGSS
ncbi:hypothetical protein SISSUDRAFT_1044704 [Sistotremastrum suecicum HHB10207 ss-3]|uniref:Glycine cleavage system H protein n=1 Tax=Sistotremastrum suecicum HHB10207 ss-3 TaxID=1314776 RepID=A0A166EYV1_9AGAM|nr:hypothetical protein SISSUDRAFT_1044704 [Sistotremastrum suecicum HHB10207 ss-3]